ncbi:MAG: DNA repair protein RadC [Anaerolineales bacterium]|nr:DNA repair protein RadC [Anaerolineales bacterium]MCW5854581.1 DNA repair protein RadC [Anaerolineales bacterium]
MSTPYRIADLPSAERPRERLRQQGARSLSTAELLAVLLRTGVPGESAVRLGERLLSHFGGLAGLQRADFDDVKSQHGLGEAKAATLKAAIELGRRLAVQEPGERPAIASPADAAALVQYEMAGLEQEHLRAILLDTRNKVIAIDEVSQGTLNSAQVRMAELFKAAIRRNAAALILVHNHPSGDPTPSADDIALTRQVREAGRLLEIEVLDHLIIGQGRYVSLKEQKLAF